MQLLRFSLPIGIVLFCASHLFPSAIFATDWNQWHGPERNGFVKDSPALVEKLEKKITPAWTSEAIPADLDGGYSSPVVVEGKIYIYCPWRTWVDAKVLKFSETDAEQLPLIPAGVSDELVAKVDTGRTALGDIEDMKARKKAAQDWLDKNLNADEKKLLGDFALQRLPKGKNALSVAALRTVRTVLGKEFANDEDFAKWGKEAGLDDDAIKRVAGIIPRKIGVTEDIIFCLDQKDGKILWKKSWSNGYAVKWGGGSSTPLVRDGKLWFMTGFGVIYCISIEDGKEIWTAKVEAPTGPNATRNSSFVYHDGLVFILSDRLYAFDAATGKLSWEIGNGRGKSKGGATPAGNNSSPKLWQSGDKTYLIAGGWTVGCIEPKTGEVLWTVPGGGDSTPAISGDRMAIMKSNKQISFYTITAAAATPTSESEAGISRGASLATDGKFFYAGGEKAAAAFDVKTGELKWEAPNAGEEFSSPLIADGKLFTFTKKGEVNMLDAATGKPLGTAQADVNRCTTPALVDGKLYIRTKEAVVCLDLKP